tara:strand:+ start:6085 stop:6849 length:765 start_codon:yes stop_codon:yes gene_type:complete
MKYEDIIKLFKNDIFISECNKYKGESDKLTLFFKNIKNNTNFIIKNKIKKLDINDEDKKYFILELNKINKNNNDVIYKNIKNYIEEKINNINTNSLNTILTDIIIEKCVLNNNYNTQYIYILDNLVKENIIKIDYILNKLKLEYDNSIKILEKLKDQIEDYDELCDYYKLEKKLKNLVIIYHIYDNNIINMILLITKNNIKNKNITYIGVSILNYIFLNNTSDINISGIKELSENISDKKSKFKLLDIIDKYNV